MINDEDVIIRHFASNIKSWDIPINSELETLKKSEEF
jgi:hypothetical protein